ncbi:hypothetical protein [Dactylosporangium sp. NPDC050588]|uniref:hypothetical protein n=1 Tax=Dactylosporangium sp. NPDC050588 TaxID=3157211 RepID=UPI0033DB3942
MTDVDEEQDHLIRLLSPTVHVPEPARAAGEDLLHAILDTGAPATNWRRRLLVGVPVAAGLTVAALVAGSLLTAPKPANAALTFTEGDGFLTVTIKDPAADPQRYRDELARRGLNIKIELVPANPENVGKVVFEESGAPGLEPIEDPGRCTANGSCQVGFKVPLNFSSYAVVAFGRTPLPGEFIEGGSTEENAVGGSLIGKRVSEARQILAANGMTAEYRVGPKSMAAPADQVPGDWIVFDTAPIPGNIIVLWSSADGKPPAPTGDDTPRPPASTRPGAPASTRPGASASVGPGASSMPVTSSKAG